MSRATISRIESRQIISPGVEILRKLSAALGVPLSELSGDRPTPRRRIEIVEGVARVPLRTLRVQADGEPSWADTEDTIVISARAGAGRPNAFAATVTGSCMHPHVSHGDVVLIDPDQQPMNGDMVVVTTGHGETLVKWYRLNPDDSTYLRAADGSVLRPDEARLHGVVFRIEKRALRDPEA